jgi:nitroreductase
MPPSLDLTPDELLSTTRAVRKRLDLTRPVDPALVDECLELAVQAPTGSNSQGWHFVVITDPELRAEIGRYYKSGWDAVYGDAGANEQRAAADPELADTTRRVTESAQYLADHMAEVPVMVLACLWGRTDGAPPAMQAGVWGSLFPAVWNFCLAARARGLGTCWTSLHLMHEREVAELLGLPDNVMQGALIPVAHTLGTDFKPGPRRDMDRIVHRDRW